MQQQQQQQAALPEDKIGALTKEQFAKLTPQQQEQVLREQKKTNHERKELQKWEKQQQQQQQQQQARTGTTAGTGGGGGGGEKGGTTKAGTTKAGTTETTAESGKRSTLRKRLGAARTARDQFKEKFKERFKERLFARREYVEEEPQQSWLEIFGEIQHKKQLANAGKLQGPPPGKSQAAAAAPASIAKSKPTIQRHQPQQPQQHRKYRHHHQQQPQQQHRQQDVAPPPGLGAQEERRLDEQLKRQHQLVKSVALYQKDNSARSLREILREFFLRYDPPVLERLENIIAWTARHGIHKLSEQLYENYGAQPFSTPTAGDKEEVQESTKPATASSVTSLSPASVPVDSEMESLCMRLIGFFRVHNPAKASREEAMKVAKIALSRGLWQMQASLEATYGENLDTWEERVATELLEPLSKFLAEHDPELLSKPRRFEAVMNWALLNGVEAMQEKLIQRYGHKLQLGGEGSDQGGGSSTAAASTPVEPAIVSRVRERAETYRSDLSSQAASVRASLVPEIGEEHMQSAQARYKVLRAQLEVFLNNFDQDFIRRHPTALDQLADWAHPKTDEQLDDYLHARFGWDLESTGIRKAVLGTTTTATTTAATTATPAF